MVMVKIATYVIADSINFSCGRKMVKCKDLQLSLAITASKENLYKGNGNYSFANSLTRASRSDEHNSIRLRIARRMQLRYECASQLYPSQQ